MCVMPVDLWQLLSVSCTAMACEDLVACLLFAHIRDFVDLYCVCSVYVLFYYFARLKKDFVCK